MSTGPSQPTTQASTPSQEANGTQNQPPSSSVSMPTYPYQQDFGYNGQFRSYPPGPQHQQYPPNYPHPDYGANNNFPYPMNSYPQYGTNLTLNQLLQQNNPANNPYNMGPRQSNFNSHDYPNKGPPEAELQPGQPYPRYPYPYQPRPTRSPNNPMNTNNSSSPVRNTPNKSVTPVAPLQNPPDRANTPKEDAKSEGSNDKSRKTPKETSSNQSASPQASEKSGSESSRSKTPKNEQQASTTPSPANSSHTNEGGEVNSRVSSPAVKKPEPVSSASTPQNPLSPSYVNSSNRQPTGPPLPANHPHPHHQKMMSNYAPQMNGMLASPMNFFGYPHNGGPPPSQMPHGYPPNFQPHPSMQPPPHQMLPGYHNGPHPPPPVPSQPHSMVPPPNGMMGQHNPLFGYPGMPPQPPNSSHNNGAYQPHMGSFNPMGPRPQMIPPPPQQQNNSQQSSGNQNSSASQACFRKLLELGNEPDRQAWLSHYFKFMDDIGKSVTTLPQIVKQTCDIYKLYFAVKERGGIVGVMKNKRWKEVSSAVAVNITAAAGFTLRKNYLKYLIDYECKFDRNGADTGPVIAEVESLSASKKRRQSPAGSTASTDDKNSVHSKANNSFNFPPPSPVGSQSSASSSLQHPPSMPPSSTPHSSIDPNVSTTPECVATPPRVNSTGPPTAVNGATPNHMPSPMRPHTMQQPPYAPGQQPNMGRENYSSMHLPPAASAPSTVVHHAPPGTVVNHSSQPPYHGPAPPPPTPQQQQQQQGNGKYSSSVLNNLMMMNQQHQQQQMNQKHAPNQMPPGAHHHHHHPQQPQSQQQHNKPHPNADQYDFSLDQNLNNPNLLHQQRMFKQLPPMNHHNHPQQHQPQQQHPQQQQAPFQHSMKKASDFFPPGSIEATKVSDSPKKKRLRPKDLPAGSLHATRILNGLRSSLNSELIWSLNIINIMLREESGSTAQEFLSHFNLPTLVQCLANILRKSLGILINKKKFIDEMELPEQLVETTDKEDEEGNSELGSNFESKLLKKLIENGLSEEDFQNMLKDIYKRRSNYPEKHSKSGRICVLENRKVYKALKSLSSVSGEANRKRRFTKILEESNFKNKVDLRDYMKSHDSCDNLKTICDYIIESMSGRPIQPEVGLEIESIEKKWLYENQPAALRDLIKKGGGDTTCHINLSPTIFTAHSKMNERSSLAQSEFLKENIDIGKRLHNEEEQCPVLSPQSHKKIKTNQSELCNSNYDDDDEEDDAETRIERKKFCPLKAREDLIFVGSTSMPFVSSEDERERVIQICLAASNAFRNLTFVSPADNYLSVNPAYLFIISQTLMLAHRHIDENEDWESVETTWDQLDYEDDKNWWWLESLRENSLVSLINLAGNLKLSNFNEVIVKGILDSVLHWIICKSSQAVDPLPFQRVISPQRLALEALNRLCVHEINVDMLLNLKENEFFDSSSKIARLFDALSSHLSMPEDQIVKELSLSTIHYLVENSAYHVGGTAIKSLPGSNISASMLVSATPCVISGLLVFIESTELNTRRVIEQFGVQALQERPDLMGCSLELVRRAGALIDKLVSNDLGKSRITMDHEQRILELATSRVLDATVAQMLSSALQKLHQNCSQNMETNIKFSFPKLPSLDEIGRLVEKANEEILKIAKKKEPEPQPEPSEKVDSKDKGQTTAESVSSPGSVKADQAPDTLMVESEATSLANSCHSDNDKDLPPPELSKATTSKPVDNNNSESTLPSLILA